MKISVLALILSLPAFLYAQNASIKGFVYEKNTGEPVIFTNVYLQGTNYGASTDVNGYYVISKIPAGSYTLLVTAMGYDSLSYKISLKTGELMSKNLFLQEASIMLQEFNVSAEREEARTETKTSVVKITPKQIEQIPTIGGTADLAQYLQVLPGVIFTGDQGGQLYIRGGSPIQNKVLLDGMVIYNPFHSIGLFSVFETDILRSADVYTGGFGAEYGGRISSIMDITTRDGNKKRLAGSVQASTFGANLLLEGPIVKQKEEGGTSSSFILSVKNSYLEQSSKIFYDYIDKDGLPFNYLDIYGKVSINGSNGSKVNLFGFRFDDQVNNYKAISDFHWTSSGAGANFVVIPARSSVLIEGTFAYSGYEITMSQPNAADRSSKINGFNGGLGFTYFLGKDELKYGLEILGFKTDYYFYNSLNKKIQQTENTTELGLFFKYKMTTGKFLIEPSMRIQWYASLSEVSPEPRLALKYNITDWLRFKMAGGFYSQNLISATSDRDVVNLFSGFLSGPDNIPSEFRGEEVNSSLQKGQHLIGGFEIDLTRQLTMNLEGYYKNFSQLTNLNRNKIFDDSPAYSDPSLPSYKPDYLKKDFIIEKGDAYGVDISFKYDYKRLYIWAVYSLAYVNRKDELIDYVPHYDRRHNINLLASYRFGKNENWEVNARWNFGSGFPFTQTQGFYEQLNFSGGIGTDITTENGELGVLYGDLNEGRLPDYHRLDLNLKKTIEIGSYSQLEINLGVTNVYDRENIFYFDRITSERVNQLPVMPSAGAKFSF